MNSSVPWILGIGPWGNEAACRCRRCCCCGLITVAGNLLLSYICLQNKSPHMKSVSKVDYCTLWLQLGIATLPMSIGKTNQRLSNSWCLKSSIYLIIVFECALNETVHVQSQRAFPQHMFSRFCTWITPMRELEVDSQEDWYAIFSKKIWDCVFKFIRLCFAVDPGKNICCFFSLQALPATD
jgi:hypothetical protein